MLGGLKSLLPIRASSYMGTGGTNIAEYCYSVWLRHMVIINRHVPGFRPKAVVELGPGDSIGLGIVAVLTGAEVYTGLDVLEHASRETNLRIFDDVIPLISNRAEIPDERSLPGLYPRLSDYRYPDGMLDDAVIRKRLSVASLESLRAELNGPLRGPTFRYVSSWGADSLPANSADLVITHGTLQDMDHSESRDDLTPSLQALARWLKTGGVMSHHIDFSCPGGQPWNHHWAAGDLEWRIIRGKRPYYKNRVALSQYRRLLEDVGLEVVHVERVPRPGLSRNEVAPRFRNLPDEDYQTVAGLVVAVKR